MRSFDDLKKSGLLWLINRTVFHPRGFALGIVISTKGEAIGWKLQGDGSEAWAMDEAQDAWGFEAAEDTLSEATLLNG